MKKPSIGKKLKNRKNSIATKILVILIFSFIPFLFGMGYSLYQTPEKKYYSIAINISGSQRMRTMLLANYSQQLYYSDKGSHQDSNIRKILSSELKIYQVYYNALIVGNHEIGLSANPDKKIIGKLSDMKDSLDLYIENVRFILSDNPDSGKKLQLVLSMAMSLKDEFDWCTNEFQKSNDRLTYRKEIFDIAMIAFAFSVTVLGFFYIKVIRGQEDSLYHSIETAEYADKLKSAFLANMSHELRTPLNSIIGFTGIILQGLAGPINNEQRKQLEMVRGSSRHLLALINDVLDLSKIEAEQLQVAFAPFNLGTVISRCHASVQPLAEKKGLSVKIEFPDSIGKMVSDERRIEQIVLNLLSNAIKFTDRGEVLLKINREAENIVIQVSDTGIGIKPEDQKTLFKRFHQLDTGISRKYEGTGLGLAICKRLAELLGGDITVESEWGKGSIFTVVLPVEGAPKV